MTPVLFSLVLLCQSEIGVPPAPAAEAVAQPVHQSVDEMRSWLLARLVIDSSFDEKKSAEARRLLDTMNEDQLKALVAAYQERTTRPTRTTTPTTAQQQELDQAKLQLQQAESYRDHLKREYDRRILQGQMTQNLIQQNILNNQMLLYRNNGLYGYTSFGVTPLGYGGLGYGIINYGGWAYGAPGYGAFLGGPAVW